MQTFQQFLATQNIQVSVLGFVLNLLLVAITSFILAHIYIRYGTSLSNRRIFAKNFVLITMTTMLVITIVKSSLALSLGLVGALSIVRFRTAIKEPEELAYLFIAIATGLGFGADQKVITLIGFAGLCLVIIFIKRQQGAESKQNLYLTVTSYSPEKAGLEEIVAILNKYCLAVDMRRFDSAKGILEASFLIEFDKLQQLLTAKSELLKLSETIKITFLDNKGAI
jgi:hypothetical protein